MEDVERRRKLPTSVARSAMNRSKRSAFYSDQESYNKRPGVYVRSETTRSKREGVYMTDNERTPLLNHDDVVEPIMKEINNYENQTKDMIGIGEKNIEDTAAFRKMSPKQQSLWKRVCCCCCRQRDAD